MISPHTLSSARPVGVTPALDYAVPAAFSDAVLVVLTLRPKGASIPWRLASSVAQLFVSAVEVSATTLTATVPVAESSSWFAAGKALGSLGQTVVSRLSPKDGQEVAISTVYQVGQHSVCTDGMHLLEVSASTIRDQQAMLPLYHPAEGGSCSVRLVCGYGTARAV